MGKYEYEHKQERKIKARKKMPPTAGQLLNIAKAGDNKKLLKLAKNNFNAARDVEVFLSNTCALTVFRHSLEDKHGTRFDHQRIRQCAKMCAVFYVAGESLPSAHEVMTNAFSKEEVKNWVLAKGVGREDIGRGLDALKFVGLAKSDNGGLCRWISHSELKELRDDLGIYLGVIDALDLALNAVGAGAIMLSSGILKLIIWSLGR